MKEPVLDQSLCFVGISIICIVFGLMSMLIDYSIIAFIVYCVGNSDVQRRPTQYEEGPVIYIRVKSVTGRQFLLLLMATSAFILFNVGYSTKTTFTCLSILRTNDLANREALLHYLLYSTSPFAQHNNLFLTFIQTLTTLIVEDVHQTVRRKQRA